MRNLINVEFYKLFKGKTFYICMLIIAGLAIGTVLLLNFTYSVSDAVEGSGVIIDAVLDEKSAVGNISNALAGGGLLLVAIMVSIVTASDFNTGTIKNLTAKSYSRLQIYFAKYTIAAVITIAAYLLHFILFTITATALWGFGTAGSGFFLTVLSKIGIQLLLYLACTAVFVMVSFTIRSAGLAVAINICIMEFASIVTSLLELALDYIADIQISLSQYLPTANITEIANQSLNSDLVIRTILVGICCFILFHVLGYTGFLKRDIK